MLQLVENLGHDHGLSPCDVLTLRYEDRLKGRLRATLDSGREAGLFLERGGVLKEGDMLRAQTGEIVRVACAPEDLVTAACGEWGLFSRACYHLGNRHVPLEIGEKWVRFMPDHVLEDLAEHLGLSLSRTQAPFHPEAGAYHGGHQH